MAAAILKVILTPGLIAVATLVGRKWGPGVGGWLVGLPLTSAPVALFLALDHGPTFAASAAGGSLVGAAAEAAFCAGYLAGVRQGWISAFCAGALGFLVASLILLPAAVLPPLPLAILVVAILVAGFRLLPFRGGARRSVTPPSWDVPARMIAGGLLVVSITAVAPLLGPQLSGIAAAFPVFATVLAVFAQRTEGHEAARDVLRGLVVGLFAFTAFFLVIGSSIETLGVGGAFSLAVVVALAVQGVTLKLVREQPLAPRPVEPVGRPGNVVQH